MPHDSASKPAQRESTLDATTAGPPGHAARLQQFEAVRPLLEGLAYRMLGSLAEAQDAVQETWLRWMAVDGEAVRDPRAWLVTVCTRLSTNALKSARARRETYVGTWLPEPWLPSEAATDSRLEIDESVSLAFLWVLEALSPLERAAFLLHDVFEYDFDEVAAVLERTPAACRKLASRARDHVRARRPRAAPDSHEHRELVRAFTDALRAGDAQAIERCLASSALLHADGGGKAKAAGPLQGAPAIARFLAAIFTHYARKGVRIDVTFCRFNGSLGALVYENGILATALHFDVRDARVHHIFAQRNPRKLAQAPFQPAWET